MRISRAEEQGIRLAIRLAEGGEQMTLGELSDLEKLPEPTVAKILGKLRQGGIVHANRGRKGGYELVDSPDATSIARLVRALGSSRTPGRFCQAGHQSAEDCYHSEECRLRAVWDFLEARMFQVLENTTVSDLLKTRSQVTAHLHGLWAADGAEGDTERDLNARKRDLPGVSRSDDE
jgi:Rrf2 family transcriptional regulator, iron-sulfur cluster assembly transcription factor